MLVQEEKALNNVLAQVVDFNLKNNTEYECELDFGDLDDHLNKTLIFKGDTPPVPEEELTEEEKALRAARSLQEQLRDLEKQKKLAVASEDFLEAANIKAKMESLKGELDGMDLPDDMTLEGNTAQKEHEKEVAANFKNWEGVKYKEARKNESVEVKEEDKGIMNFLF